MLDDPHAHHIPDDRNGFFVDDNDHGYARALPTDAELHAEPPGPRTLTVRDLRAILANLPAHQDAPVYVDGMPVTGVTLEQIVSGTGWWQEASRTVVKLN